MFDDDRYYEFEELYADTPFDLAERRWIKSHVEENYEEDIQELLEESPYMTRDQVIDWIIDHRTEQVKESYNEDCKQMHY